MKTTVIYVLVAIIAVVGIGAFVRTNSMMKTDEDTSMQPTDAVMKKDERRYVEYSESTFDSASNNRRVLFFYASWCPTCIPADVNFSQNENKIPEDVTLIRVNYNDPETDQEEKDLAKKYGITYQHTFVQIDSTNKEVVKWNGGQIDELLSNIK